MVDQGGGTSWQQQTQRATLLRSFRSRVVHSVYHHPCIQVLVDMDYHPTALYRMRQEFDNITLIDRVEEVFKVDTYGIFIAFVSISCPLPTIRAVWGLAPIRVRSCWANKEGGLPLACRPLSHPTRALA